jgi:hypothetical protein
MVVLFTQHWNIIPGKEEIAKAIDSSEFRRIKMMNGF